MLEKEETKKWKGEKELMAGVRIFSYKGRDISSSETRDRECFPAVRMVRSYSAYSGIAMERGDRKPTSFQHTAELQDSSCWLMSVLFSFLSCASQSLAAKKLDAMSCL